MTLLKLTDDCWVNPDAIIAVETSLSGTGVDVYLDTDKVLRVVGVLIQDVIDKLETWQQRAMSDFAQTLDGSVHPIR